MKAGAIRGQQPQIPLFDLGVPDSARAFAHDPKETLRDIGRMRKRKQPSRCRWPDPVRNEVLARLLKLDAERAQEERLSGDAPCKAKEILISQARAGLTRDSSQEF